MNSFADELLVGLYRGRSFSLCNGSKDAFVRTVWAPHFKNVARFPTCNTGRAVCRHDNVWSPRLSQGLARTDREYLDDLKHFLYPYIFTLTRGTQERVDQRLLSAGLPKGEPYLAVHVRRGDKLINEARRVEPGTYAEAARPFLALHSSSSRRELVLRELRAANASVVYVSSDDDQAATELGVELGNNIRIVQQPRGSEQGYDSRGYQEVGDLMTLLADVEAMRRATVFVGTASSNIGRLVYYLRPKESVTVSVDDEGDWLRRQV
jgi:hypothetical protein